MHEERLNYLSALFVENDITKSLSYEEAIKEYATKICRKKVLYVCVRQLPDKNIVNFLDFVLLVVFISFLF
jgi:malonyl CoA-acyl carrier protein transacylase